MSKKQYKCCICYKELENKDTIRLAKQLYGISKYGGHYTIDKYDFCENCYNKFENWINKHKEKK